MNSKKTKKGDRHWYDYLWIASMTYLILGFFNIMFAWLGIYRLYYHIDSVITFCNSFCIKK